MTLRPDTYRLHNGEKATAQFSTIEYETRLAGLRAIMADCRCESRRFLPRCIQLPIIRAFFTAPLADPMGWL